MELPTINGRPEFGNPEHIAAKKRYEKLADGGREWRVEFSTTGGGVAFKTVLACSKKDAVAESGLPESDVIAVHTLAAIDGRRRRAELRKAACSRR